MITIFSCSTDIKNTKHDVVETQGTDFGYWTILPSITYREIDLLCARVGQSKMIMLIRLSSKFVHLFSKTSKIRIQVNYFIRMNRNLPQLLTVFDNSSNNLDAGVEVSAQYQRSEEWWKCSVPVKVEPVQMNVKTSELGMEHCPDRPWSCQDLYWGNRWSIWFQCSVGWQAM